MGDITLLAQVNLGGGDRTVDVEGTLTIGDDVLRLPVVNGGTSRKVRGPCTSAA